MILDNNLIAYEYFKNQYVPKEVYSSGEKEETNLIDKYSFSKKELPILILKDDIINSNGYGLKKGFYNVIPDEYMDYLLIYQSGNLKAKVPVLNMTVYETNNPEQKKVKKMSQKKYERYQEKEYRKYLKGENPAEIDYKKAEIQEIKEHNAYLLIYISNNIELTGIIKY